MHFEDIWNDAEELSVKITDKNIDQIIKTIHARVDNLKGSVNLPKEQALNIGEILFELATIAKMTELEDGTKQVNVAAGLSLAVENRKSELLDG